MEEDGEEMVLFDIEYWKENFLTKMSLEELEDEYAEILDWMEYFAFECESDDKKLSALKIEVRKRKISKFLNE